MALQIPASFPSHLLASYCVFFWQAAPRQPKSLLPGLLQLTRLRWPVFLHDVRRLSLLARSITSCVVFLDKTMPPMPQFLFVFLCQVGAWSRN